MSRREALGLRFLSFAEFGFDGLAQEVGALLLRPQHGVEWKPYEAMVDHPGDNMVVFGIYIANGHVLSRGRIYTSAEFEPIREELDAYVERRNPTLRERAARLIHRDTERWMEATSANALYAGKRLPDGTWVTRANGSPWGPSPWLNKG